MKCDKNKNDDNDDDQAFFEAIQMQRGNREQRFGNPIFLQTLLQA